MSEEESKGPSLGERIETRRFLGREFLAWLWFSTEVFEQELDIEGFGTCALWLEKTLTLETGGDREKAKSKLTGGAPSGTPEAREALRQGKLPTEARIVLRREERGFEATFGADAMSLSAVKIPALLKGDGDDPFYERIQLVEELEAVIGSLYREFLELRLGDGWDDVLIAMRGWMNDDGDAIERYRSRAKKKARRSAA